MTPRCHLRRPERGSTLLLVPAAVMVLLLLGAIAVDLSAVHLARRELLRSASHAADDAAQMVDQTRLRLAGTATLDTAAAERVARFHLAVARLPGEVTDVSVVVDPEDGRVDVTASMTVEAVFSRAVPGAAGTTTVTVTATGRLLDST